MEARKDSTHSSHFILFNTNKNKHQETETNYKKALKLGANTTEGNQLLKKTIEEGEGPYVGFAVEAMCDLIMQNALIWGLDVALPELLEKQETYLSIARQKCPLLGNYFTVTALLSLSNLIPLELDNKEILTYYFIIENLINGDKESFQLLSDKLSKDFTDQEISEIENKINMDISETKKMKPNNEVHLGDGEYVKYFDRKVYQKQLAELEYNKHILATIRLPKENLLAKMNQFGITLDLPIANEAREEAKKTFCEARLV